MIAPLFEDAAGAAVGMLLREVVDENWLVVGVGVVVGDGATGKAVATPPWPDKFFTAGEVGKTVTFFAAALYWAYNAWEGGLIAPTIPEGQWGTGRRPAQ